MDAPEQKRSVYDDYEADDGSPRPAKVPRTSGFFGTALRAAPVVLRMHYPPNELTPHNTPHLDPCAISSLHHHIHQKPPFADVHTKMKGVGHLLSTPQRALNDIAARASSMSPSRQVASKQEDGATAAQDAAQQPEPSPVKKLFAAAVPSFSPAAAGAASSSAAAKPSPRARTPKQVAIASPVSQQPPKSSARKGGKTPTAQAKTSPAKSAGGGTHPIAYMSEVEDGASSSSVSPGKQPPARKSLSAEQVFSIARIQNHRTEAGLEPEVHVIWEGPDAGSPSWEPEAVIQQDAPDALLEYWASMEGGRGAYPPYAGPDPTDVVFAIIGHEWVKRQGTKRKRGVATAKGRGKRAAKELCLRVQWLGFPESEATLEAEERFRKDQPKLVQLYWSKVGGRPLQPDA
ncbi:uncharacterized protein E0L32_002109 [Thyridium curvatum]|uniref:Chromo domain-containing protein n=1 Tax=Thyridium curvatum TaxID=1093900 RepID=A0A507ALW7_9PEZI|nr:uncharacterized protein E0L32_002024 [Thyridium curvatum]XP_030989217.1 uncharacterized protein E0L32_002109 [Thyridium curvatum]TPX07421.1 hypothetical protein E0L32_002024 [Thyridium curvatum]TPX07506.1 hypothetical protein E0L32_002109 [Thyridium curvatum]